VIDCGSLEYAHARLHARHGERVDEALWRRIETLREFARNTGLQPWLIGIGADSSIHQVEAVLRGHWRALVAEVGAWMPGPWQAAIAWCAVLPDLALLQHLARSGEPAPWMHDAGVWRELAAAPPASRSALLASGPYVALAGAWPAPQTIGQVWRAEWQRRLPASALRRGDTLAALVRALLDHGEAFAAVPVGQGWLQRSALHARLSLLLRRAVLEPAAAFIHLALCALDLERLRAELLRRLLFRRLA
jgi:hypothetical protein